MTPGYPRSLTIWLLLCVVAAACGGGSRRSAPLDIATTTSVVNSGLLTVLAERFRADTAIVVRAHAAGSGRALEMLSDGVVDLVISHAPAAEARMLELHPEWRYRKIAVNHFIVVGPPGDPAGVAQAVDAADAFARIARSGATFISRGDSSGTHEKEVELWKLASVRPAPERLLISGSGMGTTLRQANERSAYTLADDATFNQLREQLTLRSLFLNDQRLANSYAVIASPDSPAALRFAAWLAEGGGRDVIAGYAAGNTQPFLVWPADCPGTTPSAPLCASK
jgi:tungstate transport system substrate-binding protein